jgi:hypothetical protein
MNVYIPDSLAEALAQFRESMSVSAVLREALEREMTGKVEGMEETARTQLFGQLSRSALTHVTRAPGPAPDARAAAGVTNPARADHAPGGRPGAGPRAQTMAVEGPPEPLKATAPRFGFGDFLPQAATAQEVEALRRELDALREEVAKLRQKVEGTHDTTPG